MNANAAVLVFRLANERGEHTAADVAVSADVKFDSDDGAPLVTLPGWQVISIWSPSHSLSFVCRDAPLVTDAATYWYSAFGNISGHRSTQVTSESFSGVDTALTISWESVFVPVRGSGTVSALPLFGAFRASAASLSAGLGPHMDPLCFLDSAEFFCAARRSLSISARQTSGSAMARTSLRCTRRTRTAECRRLWCLRSRFSRRPGRLSLPRVRRRRRRSPPVRRLF
jgi:hypothetical protein